ncbi:MAG: hypothetical protein JW910_00945, partial [Anaerolineae bacterium]|nr:hypothetical protein [Anaerolineae bacterium]
MSDKSDSLLNAMDGVARYEARQAMLRRDPAQAIPELVRMLAQGEARYPREIMALLGELGGQAALADLAQHPDKTLRSQAARALKALQDRPAPAPPTAPAAPAPRAEATPRAEKTLDEIV